MITMLLGGLWHGAAWTFVVWGGIHGAALVVRALPAHHARSRQGIEPPPDTVWRRVGRRLVTFHIVCLALGVLPRRDVPHRVGRSSPDCSSAGARLRR